MTGDAQVTRETLLLLAEQRGRDDLRRGANSPTGLRDLTELGAALGLSRRDLDNAWVAGVILESAAMEQELCELLAGSAR